MNLPALRMVEIGGARKTFAHMLQAHRKLNMNWPVECMVFVEYISHEQPKRHRPDEQQLDASEKATSTHTHTHTQKRLNYNRLLSHPTIQNADYLAKLTHKMRRISQREKQGSRFLIALYQLLCVISVFV